MKLDKLIAELLKLKDDGFPGDADVTVTTQAQTGLSIDSVSTVGNDEVELYC